MSELKATWCDNDFELITIETPGRYRPKEILEQTWNKSQVKQS